MNHLAVVVVLLVLLHLAAVLPPLDSDVRQQGWHQLCTDRKRLERKTTKVTLGAVSKSFRTIFQYLDLRNMVRFVEVYNASEDRKHLTSLSLSDWSLSLLLSMSPLYCLRYFL